MIKQKFVIPVLIISILALGMVTALTITALTAEKINIFGGAIQDTDFSVTSLDTKIKGKNRIDIDIEITNNDNVNGHSGNVTVQLLDVSGDILIEDSFLLGVVAPSGTYSYSHSFVANGIVELYNSNYIVIKQID